MCICHMSHYRLAFIHPSSRLLLPLPAALLLLSAALCCFPLLSAAPSPRAAPPTSRCPHCITPPHTVPHHPSSSLSSSLPSVFISLLHPSSFIRLPYMVAFIPNSSSGLLCTAPPTPPPRPSMPFPHAVPHHPITPPTCIASAPQPVCRNYVLYVCALAPAPLLPAPTRSPPSRHVAAAGAAAEAGGGGCAGCAGDL